MMAANFGNTTLFQRVRGLLVHIGALHASIADQIALHTKDELQIAALCRVIAEGKSLHDAMVRNRQSLVPPFYSLLHQILHRGEAIHLAHFGVAMQLHALFGGLIHAGFGLLNLQLHQAGHLHTEFVHHEAITRHIALCTQHSSQLQLALELIALLASIGKLILISLEHDFQRHAIGLIADIEAQDNHATFGLVLHKALQAAILVHGFDNFALNDNPVLIFIYRIDFACLPFDRSAPQKSSVLLSAIQSLVGLQIG